MSLFYSSSSLICPYFDSVFVQLNRCFFYRPLKETEIKPSDTDIDRTVSCVTNFVVPFFFILSFYPFLFPFCLDRGAHCGYQKYVIRTPYPTIWCFFSLSSYIQGRTTAKPHSLPYKTFIDAISLLLLPFRVLYLCFYLFCT